MRPVPFWWRMGVRIRRRISLGDFVLLAILFYAVLAWAVTRGS